jgi:hypothetical protein
MRGLSLGHFPGWVWLDGVDQIGELDTLLDEENGARNGACKYSLRACTKDGKKAHMLFPTIS